MKLFGLTGGIGMGKSTSASLLSLGGLPVIDTDVVAREIVEPGQPALVQIAEAFGSEMVDSCGELDRSRLASLVFASPDRLRLLESILHPLIRRRWAEQVAAWRSEGRPAGVVVIPLLFETGAQAEFDAVFCTACSDRTQWERLRARGWPDDQIEQRLQAQWPVERKIAASTHVIWTEGAMEIHRRQWQRLLGGFYQPRR